MDMFLPYAKQILEALDRMEQSMQRDTGTNLAAMQTLDQMHREYETYLLTSDDVNEHIIGENLQKRIVEIAKRNGYTEPEPKRRGQDVVECDGEDDGIFVYEGLLSEVPADVADREQFSIAAAEVGRAKILFRVGREIDLVAETIQVNEEMGSFQITFTENEPDDIQDCSFDCPYDE